MVILTWRYIKCNLIIIDMRVSYWNTDVSKTNKQSTRPCKDVRAPRQYTMLLAMCLCLNDAGVGKDNRIIGHQTSSARCQLPISWSIHSAVAYRE